MYGFAQIKFYLTFTNFVLIFKRNAIFTKSNLVCSTIELISKKFPMARFNAWLQYLDCEQL